MNATANSTTLFTEVSEQESAQVNGGYYGYRRHGYGYGYGYGYYHRPWRPCYRPYGGASINQSTNVNVIVNR